MKKAWLDILVGTVLVCMGVCSFVEADSGCSAGAPCSSSGKVITFYVPHNAPGCATSLEGCVQTSRPNLNGQSIPLCLDDVRAGRTKYVTLASAASNYGHYYYLGKITYKSAEDNQTHTVENVIGYVHDTGCAFNGTCPNSKWGKFSSVPRPDKIDVCTTICKTCATDAQAGAYATGKNIDYAPSGQGVPDNNPGSMFAGTGWGTYSGALVSSPLSTVNPLSSQPSVLSQQAPVYYAQTSVPMTQGIASSFSTQPASSVPVSSGLSSGTYGAVTVTDTTQSSASSGGSTPQSVMIASAGTQGAGASDSNDGGASPSLASSLLRDPVFVTPATASSSRSQSALDLLGALANGDAPSGASSSAGAFGTSSALRPGAGIMYASSSVRYLSGDNQTFTSNDMNANVTGGQGTGVGAGQSGVMTSLRAILDGLASVLRSILARLSP